jgi:PAS domain S-box-containing protein
VLVEFLERNRKQIAQEIETGAAPEWEDPTSTRLERLEKLVEELIAVLRHGERSRPLPPYASHNAAVQRGDRELIRGVVLQEAARHSSEVSVEEMVLLSDWAYATETKQLRESYRRLSGLLDETDDCFGIVGADGRIEYLNRALALQLQSMTGFSRDEIVGRTVSELQLSSEHSLSRDPEELTALARQSAVEERLFFGRWKETKFKAIQTPGEGITSVSLSIRDIHDPTLARVRLSLLSRMSGLVGRVGADDLAEALATVPVPDLADWCVVHSVENGHIVRSAVSRGDPAKAKLREAIIKAFPNWSEHPLWEEMKLTSGFQLLTDVGDALRRRLAFNEEQYRLMTREGVRSIMVQPILSRGQTAAIMTLLFTAESGRRYTRDHPPLVEELSLHAGHLIENARLLRDLHRNETRFRVSIAGARTIVFEHDLDLRYLWYYNPISTGSTFVGRTDEEMLGAEDGAALTHLKRRALRGESVHDEAAVTDPVDGARRDFRVVVEPMRDHAGNIFGIIGSATDITEEKRTQQRLQDVNEDVKKAEARTRELLELAPDAFVQCDLSFHFTDVNQAACHLLGYTRDEFLKKTVFDIITEEDADRLKAVRDKLLVPGQVERGEWILRRKDGSVLPSEVSANILPDGRWQAFARDITERKEIEKALRRAVTARDWMLRVVAHDLRNPIASITLSATLARHGSEPERLNRLDTIVRAAARMDHLTHDLLDVSLIETGQLKIEGDRVNVADLVLDAVDTQRPLASSSGVAILIEVARDGDVLWANRERMHEVFENLIGNAIKFTEAGGQITVNATRRNEDLLFSIADTGCGIPPESLPHVFEPFWQDVSRAGRLGAGLGLAITKGIVEAHGGRIWVESTVGRGSTFFFTIPKAPSEADHPTQAIHELKA